MSLFFCSIEWKLFNPFLSVWRNPFKVWKMVQFRHCWSIFFLTFEVSTIQFNCQSSTIRLEWTKRTFSICTVTQFSCTVVFIFFNFFLLLSLIAALWVGLCNHFADRTWAMQRWWFYCRLCCARWYTNPDRIEYLYVVCLSEVKKKKFWNLFITTHTCSVRIISNAVKTHNQFHVSFWVNSSCPGSKALPRSK